LSAGHAGFVEKDDEVTITAPNAGGRAWLAISGGIDVPIVLGSRSTDLRGNFGGHEGRALRDGDVLLLLEQGRFETADQPNRRFQTAAPWGASATWATIAHENGVLRLGRGTGWERFSSAA